MAVISEFPSDWSLDVAALKSLSGGDQITARFCGKDNVVFAPSHVIFVATNYLPVELEASPALKRRLVIVPFMETIPEAERDKNLVERLCKEELPGILNWAAHGSREWHRLGLAMPDCIGKATKTEFERRDIVGNFISDRLVIAPGLRVTRATLRDELVAWAEQNAIEPKECKYLSELYERLREAGAVEGKSGGVRYFDGVGAKPPAGMLPNLHVIAGK
jgi:putative DNA primase/helicase